MCLNILGKYGNRTDMAVQWRPWSDVTERGVWPVFTLFATHAAFLTNQRVLKWPCVNLGQQEWRQWSGITHLPSKIKKERWTHLKQRHHNQNTTSRKPKGQFLSQRCKDWPNGSPKWQFYQDIHAKTYYDRNSKSQQKHRLGTVSKKFTRWRRGETGRGLNRFYVATTIALSSAVYTEDICSDRVKGFWLISATTPGI